MGLISVIRHPHRTLKTVVRVGFAAMGMELIPASRAIYDARSVTGDPIEAAARAGLHPFLIEVPLHHCRIMPGAAFPCTVGSGNPFIDTLQAHAAGDLTGYAGSPLAAFHHHWQPQNAREVLGLEGYALSTELDAAGPFGIPTPWMALSPTQTHERWMHMIAKDNREHGIAGGPDNGWKGWGPVNDAIGTAEVARLVKIFGSIRDRGYMRNNAPDGDIKGVVLSRGDDFRVMITAGHHRAAALAALDVNNATIRIDNPIVRRSEVHSWPNVRNGHFDEAGALAVFDRMFEGRQPPTYHKPI